MPEWAALGQGGHVEILLKMGERALAQQRGLVGSVEGGLAQQRGVVCIAKGGLTQEVAGVEAERPRGTTCFSSVACS
jgi:hypothetical protein